MLVPGPGFEPGLEDSKSSVLPLDDSGFFQIQLHFIKYYLLNIGNITYLLTVYSYIIFN